MSAQPSVEFSLRLRVPTWAKLHSVSVNDVALSAEPSNGWVTVRCRRKKNDTVESDLPMPIKRVTMPARFKEYQYLAVLQRGPIV